MYEWQYVKSVWNSSSNFQFSLKKKKDSLGWLARCWLLLITPLTHCVPSPPVTPTFSLWTLLLLALSSLWVFTLALGGSWSVLAQTTVYFHTPFSSSLKMYAFWKSLLDNQIGNCLFILLQTLILHFLCSSCFLFIECSMLKCNSVS